MVTVQRFAFAAFVFLQLGVLPAHIQRCWVCPGAQLAARSAAVAGALWGHGAVAPWVGVEPCARARACVLEATATLGNSVRGVRHAYPTDLAWTS